MMEAKIKAIAPWFGSNRMNARAVGDLFVGCEWVGVVFAGGMSEVQHVKSRAIVVNDIHRHVMNLACVLSIDSCRQHLAESLANLPFHPDVLKEAQRYCDEMERGGFNFSNAEQGLDERWALNYFVACWMNRSALAGTKGEFRGSLPVRWSASGGDSNTRFRSMVESIEAWGKTMRRCNFTTLDFRQFLDKCKDAPKHGIYSDSPFPDAGEKYKYDFNESDHRDLAARLATYTEARVVCRFYDHPLVRELYPESRWTWKRLTGRDQSNNAAKPELLLVNKVATAELF